MHWRFIWCHVWCIHCISSEFNPLIVYWCRVFCHFKLWFTSWFFFVDTRQDFDFATINWNLIILKLNNLDTIILDIFKLLFQLNVFHLRDWLSAFVWLFFSASTLALFFVASKSDIVWRWFRVKQSHTFLHKQWWLVFVTSLRRFGFQRVYPGSNVWHNRFSSCISYKLIKFIFMKLFNCFLV